MGHRVGLLRSLTFALLLTLVPDIDALEIGGEHIGPATRMRVWLEPTLAFTGAVERTPVDVVRGSDDLATVLCVVAGIHGDELNGIEAVRRLRHAFEPGALRGTVVMLPIASVTGFRNASRYLPDRRDLNRSFPGSASGSLAARIAQALFDGVVHRCTHLVDLHTGSARRTNAPHVRGELDVLAVRRTAIATGLPVLHGAGAEGTLRGAAVATGIAAVTIEAGQAHRFEESAIEAMRIAVLRVAGDLEMLTAGATPARNGTVAPIFRDSRWVRADGGGMLLRLALPGEVVCAGASIGRVLDPLTDHEQIITAPFSGWVLGVAVNQIVMPGYAVAHVALHPESAARVPGLESCPR